MIEFSGRYAEHGRANPSLSK
ncbi:hypothetical protein MASSI9I_90705 [Massilia sp. 9I]|nr:hypothetical protein MASSI9I_90705 [Massilia sp. 9I]